MCPIVLVGVFASAAVALKRPEYRREGVVALVVFVLYLALVSGWSGTPLLEETGTRYMIAAFPFVADAAALCWRRVRLIAICAALWGGWLMTPPRRPTSWSASASRRSASTPRTCRTTSSCRRSGR